MKPPKSLQLPSGPGRINLLSLPITSQTRTLDRALVPRSFRAPNVLLVGATVRGQTLESHLSPGVPTLGPHSFRLTPDHVPGGGRSGRGTRRRRSTQCPRPPPAPLPPWRSTPVARRNSAARGGDGESRTSRRATGLHARVCDTGRGRRGRRGRRGTVERRRARGSPPALLALLGASWTCAAGAAVQTSSLSIRRAGMRPEAPGVVGRPGARTLGCCGGDFAGLPTTRWSAPPGATPGKSGKGSVGGRERKRESEKEHARKGGRRGKRAKKE